MQIVLEHVRLNRPNLTEIHCLRSESKLVSQALEQVTGKVHLPLDVCGETHSVYITDGLTLAEGEALLIGLRSWKIKGSWTRRRLQTIIRLEQFIDRVESRIHDLDCGLDSYDFADTEVGW